MDSVEPPARQVPLHFSEASRAGSTHTNLSAVRVDGEHLWIAGDETATLERLTAQRDADGRVAGYGGEVSVRLADLVELPAGPEEEADLEGLARQGPWLWAVGSHSLKRKRVRPGDDDAKARKRLAKVVREENRYVLVRLPVDPATGLPARRVGGRDGGEDGAELTAAVLGGRGDSLAELLAGDDLIGPFLGIPSKDNGVDVEGLAVHAGEDGEPRVFVGFRGPVLRGWAVVAEVRPRTDPDDPHRLRLARFADGPGRGKRYRLHLLDLDGLGVRDLCPHGEDLLVLAGPSMSLSGPVRVHRWVGAGASGTAPVVRRDGLPLVLELPHGRGEDHAEGLAVLPPGAHGGGHGEQLLVVLDSPAALRVTADGAVLADVFDLPAPDQPALDPSAR